MDTSKLFLIGLVIFLIYFFKFESRVSGDYDIVYTWVNGSDPRHISDLARFLNVSGMNMTNRFRDNNELRYSLRSIEKYAPWVRNVYLVTSGHFPWWLNTNRVRVVTHREIFRNISHLPVFSSPAIEANIHRIKGLSSKFIYLNDDVFFGNHIKPTDFLNEDGYKVYLTWPVPGCAEGCSDKYIGDGYCDSSCNVAECNFDGGDCKNEKKNTTICATGCNDKWFGDKYCDSSCNVLECGFDGGDCGIKKMKKHIIPFNHVTLPDTAASVIFNVSNFKAILSVFQNNPAVVRTAVVSSGYKLLTMTLFREKAGSVEVTINNSTISINFEKSMNQTSRKLQTLISNDIQVESPAARKPLGLDKFGASLVHVGKLLTAAYGHAERHVPAHMPHFIDKEVMKEVISNWEHEFNVTSSNRFRSEDDMQYTFTYFYYIMHHGKKQTLDEIFENLDRDKSGDLDDYEIQLLAYSLWKQKVKIGTESPSDDPMTKEYYHAVLLSLKNEVKHSSTTRPDIKSFKHSDVSGKVPLKRNSKFKFQLSSLDQVAFHMIRDDEDHVNSQLDDVRWKGNKFVCLNDDMNSTVPNSNVIRSLNNFYEWYFPTRSKFELSEGVRNQAMYAEDLGKNSIILLQVFSNGGIVIFLLIWVIFVVRTRFD